MSKPIIPYFQSDIEKLARLRRPGAGGDRKDDDKSIVPDVYRKIFGKFFSNTKVPVGYEKRMPGAQDVGTGLVRTATGNDNPVWDLEKESYDEDPRYMESGRETIKAADFLNRAGFMGLDNPDSNRLGGGDLFDVMNEKTVKPKPGTFFQDELDKLANMWGTGYVDREDFGNDRPLKENLNSRNIHSVMNRFELDQIPDSEGEDEKGYFFKVGGKDKYDYALHKGENPLGSVSNYVRSVTDAFMDPVDVEYESKVYVPGVKKKPRKLITPGGYIQNADSF